MIRLSKEQCDEWLVDMSIELDGHHFLPTNRVCYAADFSQPDSSRGLAILARQLGEFLKIEYGGFLYVTRWGTWPSEESTSFFEKAVIGYGDSRTLEEAPGFIFDHDDNSDFQAFIRWMLICGWSGGAISKGIDRGSSFTDDNWIGIFGSTRVELEDWWNSSVQSDEKMKILWQGSL